MRYHIVTQIFYFNLDNFVQILFLVRYIFSIFFCKITYGGYKIKLINAYMKKKSKIRFFLFISVSTRIH